MPPAQTEAFSISLPHAAQPRLSVAMKQHYYRRIIPQPMGTEAGPLSSSLTLGITTIYPQGSAIRLTGELSLSVQLCLLFCPDGPS